MNSYNIEYLEAKLKTNEPSYVLYEITNTIILLSVFQYITWQHCLQVTVKRLKQNIRKTTKSVN